jgi:hypothetical protein
MALCRLTRRLSKHGHAATAWTQQQLQPQLRPTHQQDTLLCCCALPPPSAAQQPHSAPHLHELHHEGDAEVHALADEAAAGCLAAVQQLREEVVQQLALSLVATHGALRWGQVGGVGQTVTCSRGGAGAGHRWSCAELALVWMRWPWLP